MGCRLNRHISTDGFNKTINLYQAFNSTQYSGSEILLAIAKNGKWITDTSKGPLKLIAPGLASHITLNALPRSNCNVDNQRFRRRPSTSIVLTGQNITSFETKTVEAAFAPVGRLRELHLGRVKSLECSASQRRLIERQQRLP